MRLYCFLILTLVCSVIASAQKGLYSFSRLDVHKGLSHNQVNTIIKDSSGFVWFGTMSGLNRYDGYNVKVFRNKTGDSTSLLDNYISDLFELPGNKLWVATRSGPNIYDARLETFHWNTAVYLKSLRLPEENLLTVIHTGGNDYWFVFDSVGIFQYHPGGVVKQLNLQGTNADDLTNNPIVAAKPGRQQSLWIVRRNGMIECYNLTSGKRIYTSLALQDRLRTGYDYELFVDNDNQLWAWTYNEPNGVFFINPAIGTCTQFDEGSASNRISNNLVTGVIQDSRGLIWVSTDHGGINLIDKSSPGNVQLLQNNANNLKTISQNSIYSLYKDDAGIIWIGTFKQGVNYLDENVVKFAHYRNIEKDKTSLPFDDVNRFAEDRDGNVWIGTNGGGLIYFDRHKQTFTQYLHDPADPHSISNNVIVSLCLDHNDVLWVGTYLGGLNAFDGKQFKRYTHNEKDSTSLIDDRVWEIFEDSRHQLWIGTLAGGLELFDRSTGVFHHHQYIPGRESLVQSNYISALIEDRNKNLWIGTAYGLDKLDHASGKTTHYANSSSAPSLSNNNVISLAEDSKGRIWIGTREGLSVLEPATNQFRSFYREQGLPDNTILNVVTDKKGHLWITTPNGLCKLQLREGKSFSDLNFSVINYDELNNLQGREFNDNAALALRNGDILVGGPAGFNIIQPSSISGYNHHPKIVFTTLEVLNKTVHPGETINNRVLLPASLVTLNEIHLKHRENVFSIDFTPLDFSHGSSMKYAYKLEGFNKEWVYTDENQRRITYTNLDPGAYVLRVKALNSDGSWSEEKTLHIVIDPPFWRTPLAFILYVLALITILLIARRATVARARMRFEIEQQKTEAQRVLALDRLKTKFFTNVSHEFRTPLSLIISPLDKIIKETGNVEQKRHLQLVQRNARRLLNLVNQLLDFRKMEVEQFALHPAAGDIIAFLKEISYSFSDIAEKKNISFDFHSNTDALEAYFDKDKIEKIMFNLLSNAYKYTHESGVVWVHLAYHCESEHTLCIEVGDTGIGIPADKHEKIFERFFQDNVPASMVNQGSGIGLAITKEFVKLHEGVIEVESEPNKGSVFIVRLPVKELHPNDSDTTQTVSPSGEKQHLATGKTIMLVEDNDDFRFYLKDNLKANYVVLEAVNGREAWLQIKTVKPDLIVSDIMMPEMTGLELVEKLKTDHATARIPIILLTAVGSQEMQMEGYQKGISDYITKPFTFEILATRIKNLLDQDRLLKKRVNKQMEVNPSAPEVTPIDEQFMKQALALVEKNISKPEFSVEEFSRTMFLSRVALYKKILALTGKSPLEFIRSVRLKRAAQLLSRSGLTVSEIAYEVGFNNPKTFSRYFKDQYNVLPSQYASQAGKDAGAE